MRTLRLHPALSHVLSGTDRLHLALPQKVAHRRLLWRRVIPAPQHKGMLSVPPLREWPSAPLLWRVPCLVGRQVRRLCGGVPSSKDAPAYPLKRGAAFCGNFPLASNRFYDKLVFQGKYAWNPTAFPLIYLERMRDPAHYFT